MLALRVAAILVTAIGGSLYANDAIAKIAGVIGEMNNDILTNWIGSR